MEAFLCGGGAAIVAITATHPIDVVKTRLQVQGELQARGAAAQQPKAYSSIVGSLRTIHRHEGVRGLYRGLTPAIGLQFGVTAVRFAVYDIQKRLVGEEFGKGATQGEQSVLRNFAMGCMGGLWGGPRPLPPSPLPATRPLPAHNGRCGGAQGSAATLGTW